MTSSMLRVASAAAVTFWLAATAWGQPAAPPAAAADAKGYKVLTPYIDPALKPADSGRLKISEGKARTLIRQILTGQATLADNKAQFDFFYNRMYFPNFTQTTDEALKDLPIERQRLFRDHLESASVADVHAYLLNMVFAQMQDIVKDNYHPACRYNAMLVISGLNDIDTTRVGANKTTPEPMVRALPFIYTQFTAADNSDAIRMAALLGLVRHLEWDNFRGPAEPPFAPAIPAPLRAEIVKALLELSQQKDPPAGREPAGHEWFRRRAIEGLTHASYNKIDPAIAAAMNSLLTDEQESLAVRCAAATAIGKVVYQAPVKLEPKATAKELGYLALLACHRELTRATDLVKSEEERLMRSSSVGGYGGGTGSEGGGGIMPSRVPGVGSSPTPSGRMNPRMSGGSSATMSGGMRPPSGGMRPPAGGMRPPSGAMSSSGMMGSDGSGMMGSDGYGMAEPADPKQYRFDLIRSRIRAQLYAVEIGLGGPDVNLRVKVSEEPVPARGVEAVAKGTPDQTYVGDVKAGVGKLVEAVEKADSDLVALDKAIRKQMPALEKLTRKLAAAAPVDAISDDPDAPAAAKPAPGAARPASPVPAESPEAPAGDEPAPMPRPEIPAAPMPVSAPAAPAVAAP